MSGVPLADDRLTLVDFAFGQVGLPARGKSYLSNKLMRYLQARFDLLQFSA